MLPRAFLTAAVLALVAGGAPAASSQLSTAARTLVVTHSPIASFAQDGRQLAWVTREGEKHCRRLLHFRRAVGGPTVGLRIGCHLSRDLALAGRNALWKTFLGGGNTELDLAVNTATAGDRRPHTVERLQMSIDLDTGFPNPDPPLMGAGSLLAYYAVDEPFHEQDVRRVVHGAARTMFAFYRPSALAVDGRRVAVVRQELAGDGCGCSVEGAWSPDGRKIAFLQGRVNDNSIEPAEVVVMNADGSSRTAITHDGLIRFDTGAAASGLGWSPDGGKIAYSYWKNGGIGWTIAVVNDDGTATHDLALGREPAWSPDGSTIAFSSSMGGAGIYLMNADGSSVGQLTSSGEGPAWSPDGTRLAYTNAGSLYVVNADGTGLRTLVASGPYARNPTWSPDGSEIAFSGQAGWRSEGGGLWVVHNDGSDLHQLTGESDGDPSWSPDGAHILFTSARDDITHVERVQLELYTMKSDGTDVRPLTFVQPTEWASVGELRSQSGRRLATFRATGAPARSITLGVVSDSRSVALGGGRIAVLSVLGQTGKPQISLFDAESGALQHVVEVPAAGQLELAGVTGRRVVFRTGRTVRLLDAVALRMSVLTVLHTDPIGLSVSGGRVAWAENRGSVGRIRAIQLR